LVNQEIYRQAKEIVKRQNEESDYRFKCWQAKICTKDGAKLEEIPEGFWARHFLLSFEKYKCPTCGTVY
jgi:hypothetical protein